MKKGTAYFVKRPRTQEELVSVHSLEDEHPYEVIKKITLGSMDYENFSFDMLADRQFIEDNACLCEEGDVFKCLLICRRGGNDGILVVPERISYVKWAAYLSEVKRCGQQ